jgi:hypothetical protein
MDKQETMRITIMAGILAIFFGIKQSIIEQTFKEINMEFSLKFLSDIFFQLLLVIYLFYFLILALNYGHKNLIKPKWVGFLFDLIVTATIVIIFITLSIMGLIQLMVSFPQYIQAGWKTNLIIVGIIVLSAIFFSKNLKYYPEKLVECLSNKRKNRKINFSTSH